MLFDQVADTSQEQKAQLDVINAFFTHGFQKQLSIIFNVVIVAFFEHEVKLLLSKEDEIKSTKIMV
jgi:hypothetical protein